MDDEALAAAAAFGMPEAERRARSEEAREQADRNALEIWPENWRPLLLAVAMQTQVRLTMKGAVGFDYGALPVVEARIGLPAPTDPVELAREFTAFRHIEKIYFSR